MTTQIRNNAWHLLLLLRSMIIGKQISITILLLSVTQTLYITYWTFTTGEETYTRSIYQVLCNDISINKSCVTEYVTVFCYWCSSIFTSSVKIMWCGVHNNRTQDIPARRWVSVFLKISEISMSFKHELNYILVVSFYLSLVHNHDSLQ